MQKKTPLYDALIRHMKRNPVSFHVPGHKYGKVFPRNMYEQFSSILSIDATELTGLDDLHAPHGVIKEAESLLAKLYKADRSFFLVNGTTVGNLAMIMAVCQPGDLVLVQRNCHKSILNGLKLANVRPLFLEPQFNPQWKIAEGVSYETVENAIKLYPNVKALILTYPNYYGVTMDLKEIIKKAHQFNIPVLVDEAHGAHFILGEPFPSSAVELGADIVVQSAHKTLPALTMGSYLHVNKGLVSILAVKEHLEMFQSSSPSYPIMSSLDIARSYLGTFDMLDIQTLLRGIEAFKEELTRIPAIKVLSFSKHVGDALKITIQSTTNTTGFELQQRFENEGIFTELADPYNVLLVYPLLKKKATYPTEDVINKMKYAVKDLKGDKINITQLYSSYRKQVSGLVVQYDKMQTLKKQLVSFNDAIGKIAAEMIIPYPPGIPLLLEGEEITRDHLEELKLLKQSGARFQGGLFLNNGQINVFAL
ncbi:aminotransferase class I/II-fold pyridoxal phosphate-dependent enzyme [Bacillus aquiflavi]|nr:aminotransferase class I/II-fold pyridoxal phosphate-dependent enzyme [Bacillus aquiflavi]UAC48208.1 aminotransferase class I/II-fold pyridoxal phosphate-dependent enzyme [Bacillus aquiflavi]